MSNSLPAVSVVIPAYNCERYIGQAIDGVLGQDYPNLQVIVVNDGSSDGTEAVLRSYASRVAIVTQSNQGATAARNAGLRRAEGEYIALLDGDDAWLPGKLKAQITALLAYPECRLSAHAFAVWPPDERTGAYPSASVVGAAVAPSAEMDIGWAYPKILMDCFIHTSTVILHRDLIRQIGLMDPALEFGEDYDFFIRACMQSPLIFHRRAYSLYRTTPGSFSGRVRPRNWELIVVASAAARWGLVGRDGASLSPRAWRHRRAGLHREFGYCHFRRGDPVTGAKALAHAFVLQPTRPKTLAYAALSGLRVLTQLGRRGAGLKSQQRA